MKKIFFCILVSCLAGATAFAQVNNATLTGTVADATRAVLPGVTVTATNTGTGVVVSNVRNEAGAYTILSLVPEKYTVTTDLPVFQKLKYTRVEIYTTEKVVLIFTFNV